MEDGSSMEHESDSGLSGRAVTQAEQIGNLGSVNRVMMGATTLLRCHWQYQSMAYPFQQVALVLNQKWQVERALGNHSHRK